MAKIKNEKVIIEDIELKPQVIGYTYKKKSNLGRVIFTFAVFILVVFYINDISVFFNNLIGKNSAESIKNLTTSNKDMEENKNSDNTKNEVVFNIFDASLSIVDNDITLNNFAKNNNVITFDVVNISNKNIDYSDKKYFIETYNENKTLLERFKINITSIAASDKLSIELETTSDFYYIVFEEKNVADYPSVVLTSDAAGVATITCVKGIENIIYTFKNDKLDLLQHTISDSNVSDENYYSRYNAYQGKTTSYNNLEGFATTFNGTLNGYTAVISIDLKKADLKTVQEKYYFAYNEDPKVVKFEMQTYGFNCN